MADEPIADQLKDLVTEFENRMKAIRDQIADQWEAQRKAVADLVEQEWNAQRKASRICSNSGGRNAQSVEAVGDTQRKEVADLIQQQWENRRKEVADMLEQQRNARRRRSRKRRIWSAGCSGPSPNSASASLGS